MKHLISFALLNSATASSGATVSCENCGLTASHPTLSSPIDSLPMAKALPKQKTACPLGETRL